LVSEDGRDASVVQRDSPDVVVRTDGGVLHLTLNRPGSRNALSVEMIHTIADQVSAAEASERWQALIAFAEAHGHFLVTNRPYRVLEWTPRAARLAAVREITYPMGFGSFDRYVEPLRAIVSEMQHENGSIVARVEVERDVRSGRETRIVREPLSRQTSRGIQPVLVASRYLLIGPDNAAIAAGKARWVEGDRFVIDLPASRNVGEHTLLLAVSIDGNLWTATPGILRFDAREADR
jgi:hypothetical protein